MVNESRDNFIYIICVTQLLPVQTPKSTRRGLNSIDLNYVHEAQHSVTKSIKLFKIATLLSELLCYLEQPRLIPTLSLTITVTPGADGFISTWMSSTQWKAAGGDLGMTTIMFRGGRLGTDSVSLWRSSTSLETNMKRLLSCLSLVRVSHDTRRLIL